MQNEEEKGSRKVGVPIEIWIYAGEGSRKNGTTTKNVESR